MTPLRVLTRISPTPATNIVCSYVLVFSPAILVYNGVLWDRILPLLVSYNLRSYPTHRTTYNPTNNTCFHRLASHSHA